MENESEYRKKIQVIFDKIERVFESVDPDLAECEQSLGALTITFSDRSRCILSAQPSVRQLWLALASRGTAYHFSWDSQQGKWLDDKGKGIELIQCLEDFFKDMTGKEIQL
jgi:iron donor protein CyaY